MVKGEVAIKPTTRFETVRGSVTVTTWLYGDVDDARLQREHASAEHRAEQLSR